MPVVNELQARRCRKWFNGVNAHEQRNPSVVPMVVFFIMATYAEQLRRATRRVIEQVNYDRTVNQLADEESAEYSVKALRRLRQARRANMKYNKARDIAVSIWPQLSDQWMPSPELEDVLADLVGIELPEENLLTAD